MCYKVICQVCYKMTWTGCGQHISIVMAGIPIKDRCVCKDSKNKTN